MELVILGIRGVPATHGGFETFAEFLCKFLVKRGWTVTVYCQEEGVGQIYETSWEGVRRIHIPVRGSGCGSTVLFDLKSVVHSLKQKGLILTLGYNTAIFGLLYNCFGRRNLVNMDGIEWRRDKWGSFAKAWFWLNERIGCLSGSHLIADHPEIENHLSTRTSLKKITMIPYGGEHVDSPDLSYLDMFGVSPGCYSIVIARPEPENSIFEIVRSFSSEVRDHKLIVLGSYNIDLNLYHRKVVDAASGEVIFVGAIYDAQVVQALRYYSKFYVHGHTVGGTNPSLVEAMAAGCAVIAHDNRFNRWVAGDGAAYFSDERECGQVFADLLGDEFSENNMRDMSKARYSEEFTWDRVLALYEKLLVEWYRK